MSEKQNRGIGDLSKYDAMTTEELEEILRLDAQAPEEQESDTETILYIMEVLTKRERNNSHTGMTALEAYESFKQNYMSEDDNNEVSYNEPVKTKNGFSRWLRRLTAAAAVLAILVLGSVTAKAFGFNIWEAVVKWTQETFHFGEWGNSNTDSDLPYASLQEALEKGNVPISLAPTWSPDGFDLTIVKVEKTPLKNVYMATYTDQEKILRITVQDYLGEIPVYVEQSEGLIEEYEVSGVTYYIFANNKQVRATWLNGSYECDISGDVTIEELKKMIDSIQKG